MISALPRRGKRGPHASRVASASARGGPSPQGALQRSEARLRLAVEAARMGTWDIELVGPVTPGMTFSEGYGELFGMEARQLPRTTAQAESLLKAVDELRVTQPQLALQEVIARVDPETEADYEGFCASRW